MTPLSKEIRMLGVAVNDRQTAWPLRLLPTVLKEIAESEQATLGGQKWIVQGGELSLWPANDQKDPAWETGARKLDESWLEYCARTFRESIGALEKLPPENETNELLGINIFYCPLIFEEDDILFFVPRHKHDLERARTAVKAGYPAVDLILPQLLEWLQDMNWPVAGALVVFLASIGRPLIPHLQKIFKSDDEVWKYWIINSILSRSAELAAEFRPEMERLAYSPTESEVTDGLDECAQDFLSEMGWLKSEVLL